MAEDFAAAQTRTFPQQTDFEAYAAAFGRSLCAGDTVALSGGLGAGKTTFVRAAVASRHGAQYVTSPTFTFRHRYPGIPPIDHLDLYRLDDPSDLPELGLEDVFDGSSIVFVEWWTNAPGLLPETRYELTISGSGTQARTIALERRP
ncbi:MAG: tRNA (adenosine(37)-N6)-threonylcarbamoyltransferase complex ATPase subunit type 1 TsaE [Candidatus Eremiobacteraeota bacterium]|nr:tRNA (adenosine(37)-N6)-threonylcarbamoyltransferase complex ATPase subunit type 1 TsaE [Candidatus Eremiobacteraeota bacterium]